MDRTSLTPRNDDPFSDWPVIVLVISSPLWPVCIPHSMYSEFTCFQVAPDLSVIVVGTPRSVGPSRIDAWYFHCTPVLYIGG